MNVNRYNILIGIYLGRAGNKWFQETTFSNINNGNKSRNNNIMCSCLMYLNIQIHTYTHTHTRNDCLLGED